MRVKKKSFVVLVVLFFTLVLLLASASVAATSTHPVNPSDDAAIHRLTMDNVVFVSITGKPVHYRAQAQLEGWASTVHHFFIASDADDPAIGAVQVFRHPETGEDDLGRALANIDAYYDRFVNNNNINTNPSPKRERLRMRPPMPKEWMLAQYKPMYALRHVAWLYPDKEWYVFVDDDTFVNTHALLEKLASSPRFSNQSRSRSLCIGDIWKATFSAGWAHPDAKKHYNQFRYSVGGAGYVVSNKLFKALAAKADTWIQYLYETTWNSDILMV
eukprot:GEZU01018471.1.p1 GENE.GEZU01018471.1~~GEZU01018471.1.p1  ORF type:complete len:273 (+),score=42.71 GEZU01018471.1:24-842(+)